MSNGRRGGDPDRREHRGGRDDPGREDVLITVGADAEGERLDRFLAGQMESLSRSRIQKLIDAGDVRIDGVPADKSAQPVEPGQRVQVRLPEPEPARPLPEDLPLTIVHEDDSIVVVDKQPDIVVHPGAGRRSGTLVNALLHRFGHGLSSVGGPHRPGIVHRLDKGTSGVMVVARTDAAHRALSQQFRDRSVAKEYDAFVYGRPEGEGGVIDVALGRDRSNRTRISPRTDRPRRAVTRWELQEAFRGFAWLKVRPETGRTHQVRAHLRHLQHPCIGDRRYAGSRWKGAQTRWLRDGLRRLSRPALHARRLAFDHPDSGERVAFEAPLPADLQELLGLLRRWRDEGG